jgi:hypothetical protein
MISKSISVSRKLAKISPFAALLFTWIIPHTDDGGNMAGDSETVKALVIPARPENVKDVEKAIDDLVEIGLLDRYTVNLNPFVHVIQSEKHQTLRLDRAQWIYPAWPKGDGNQTATTRQPSAAEGKGREGKGKEDKSYTSAFETFWSLYPRKVAKVKAFQSWKHIKPNESLAKKIMTALEAHCASDSWKKEDGRYIPHPTTWLNQERWDDELKITKRPGSSKFDNVKSEKV